MTERFAATARVETIKPGRYIKQLRKHFGRHRSARPESDGGLVIEFDDGECMITEVDGAIFLRATSLNVDQLGRVKAIVGGHLERFGRRESLIVYWCDGRIETP